LDRYKRVHIARRAAARNLQQPQITTTTTTAVVAVAEAESEAEAAEWRQKQQQSLVASLRIIAARCWLLVPLRLAEEEKWWWWCASKPQAATSGFEVIEGNGRRRRSAGAAKRATVFERAKERERLAASRVSCSQMSMQRELDVGSRVRLKLVDGVLSFQRIRYKTSSLRNTSLAFSAFVALALLSGPADVLALVCASLS